MITVPCCEICHKKTTIHDEYFKTCLALRHDVNDHPDIREIVEGVYRSLTRKDKVQFARRFFARRGKVNVQTRSGIFLGQREGFQVSMDRIYQVTGRVAKGLYYRETRNRLPSDCRTVSIGAENFRELAPQSQLLIARNIAAALDCPVKTIGNDILSYAFLLDSIDPRISVWLFVFYGAVPFVTQTLPP